MLLLRVAMGIASLCLWAIGARAEDPLAFAPAPEGLGRALASWVAQDRIGGAVLAVARRGEPPVAATAGSLDGERPMPADAVFRIYSMTKPVVCAAALRLVEEGRLALGDPVRRHLPEFAGLQALRTPESRLEDVEALEREPTIRDLMTHTSGITSADWEGGPLRRAYVERGIQDRRSPGGLAEMVRRLAALPLLHPPGRTWTYGESTTVLGRVLEVASGEPLDALLRHRVFEPLGMRDSGFVVTPPQRERFAAMFVAGESGRLQPARGEPPLEEARIPEPPFTEPPPTVSGGGGLVSTAADYVRFARALLVPVEGRRILRDESLATMTRPQLAAQELEAPYLKIHFPGSSFGLCGVVVTDPSARGRPGGVGTYHWSGFASTHFWVDPQAGFAAVFLTQLRPPFSRLSPADVEAAVYAAYGDGPGVAAPRAAVRPE